ncbi:3'-5' exonuclease [Halomonas campaniensis]|uniref:3'-5' exonuclease n=1 Tax=Halomonas campaniensis TaxID=213554 RepID=UPI003970A619
MNHGEARRGFILTRHWEDTPRGTEVTLWLATDEGPLRVRLPVQPAVAFLPVEQRKAAEALLVGEPGVTLRELELRDFHRRPVVGLYCEQYRQLLRLERRLGEAGIMLHEADIRPPERYLMERFITAPVAVTGKPDGEGGLVEARLRPAPDYRPRLRTVSLDIETSGRGELYSIALEGGGQRVVFMLGSASGGEGELDFTLEYCDSRAELLRRLDAWFAEHDPDAIIGWNLVQFDLRLLRDHAERLGVPLRVYLFSTVS